VRVTSPLASAPTHAPRSARQEIDEDSGVGEVYIRSLVRTQLRSAVAVAVALLVGVGSLPLVFALLPAAADARVGPVPLPWLLLGVGVYPLLLLVGWLYVRRAEAAEADFATLVEAAERR
jgi:hypothetical protein